MAVSEAIENYLETILILSKQQNEVHAVDICSYLSYSRPTVSIVLRQMRENGLVRVDEYNHIHLTDEGYAIASAYTDFAYSAENGKLKIQGGQPDKGGAFLLQRI